MNRNDFAAGKKDDEQEKADKIAKAVEAAKPKSKLTGEKMVGPGHSALKGTLIPDSFIKKMNEYLPEKSK